MAVGSAPGGRPAGMAAPVTGHPPVWIRPPPAPLTGVIGREQNAVVLRELLLRPGVRLITLTGPGGVGKTRLAIEVASALDTGFESAAFVALATIRDPALVPVTIARAVGLQVADEAAAAALRAYLQDRSMLLVFDNVEHLLDTGPALVDLLHAAPGVTMLVTSRAVLRVTGEYVMPVPPLAMPGPDPLPPVAELERFSAIRLFVERAQAVRHGFALDQDNAVDVVEVCRRLDGLPLALELAAARVRIFPPAALLARFEHRLHLLTGGVHDQPERLRTMRSGIAWSYDLLSPDQQYLFRRLAVFVGGCTVAAAEAVAPGPGSAAETVAPGPGSAMDGVAALVDQSLLRPAPADGGEPRFTMLEIIREYGVERLAASGEEAQARAAHVGYFLDLAERAESGLRGPAQQHWRDLLEADLGNLRAAFDWTLVRSTDPVDAGRGLRLVGALWYFWFQRGLTGEARRWLARALDQASDRGRARAQALLGAGTLAWRQGDCGTARAYLDESVELWRDAGDRQGVAEALHVLGHVCFDQRDHAAARDLFERSHAAYLRAGDQLGASPLVGDLGLVAYHQGDYAAAERTFRDSLALYRRQDVKDRIAGVLNSLGDLALLAGDDGKATALYQESLALWQELRGTPGIASALHKLGQVSRRRGDDRLARARLAEALVLQRDLGNKQGIAECLAAVGGVAATAGRAEYAAQLFAASSALLDGIGVPLAPVDQQTLDQDVTYTRDQLGTDAWAVAWSIGSELSTDDAISLALTAADPAAAAAADATGAPDRMAGADAGRSGVGRLSAREQEVSRLVAAGLTNREISRALSISEKTVGSHLDHIMTKLGLRSRTRIAVWAVEHGLRPAD